MLITVKIYETKDYLNRVNSHTFLSHFFTSTHAREHARHTYPQPYTHSGVCCQCEEASNVEQV